MSAAAGPAPAAALTGVLLVNLGTPEAPTPAAVRRYLREFLSDRFVVDLPPALWRPVLELAVLPRRGRSSAALYRRVWSERGSPLLFHGLDLRERLQEELGEGFAVGLAMRYGTPSIGAALDALRRLSVARLVVLPLFPQYCRATTGTIAHRVRDLARGGGLPQPRFVHSFPEDPAYVACVADGVRRAAGPAGPEHLLISFHGVPERLVRAGDPYARECERTAAALVRELELSPGRWSLAYQSRFGREAWLRPATDERARELARTVRRLHVVCPGFAADCLETIDEIGELLAADFRKAGGEELVLVPCLNADPAWARALADLVRGVL